MKPEAIEEYPNKNQKSMKFNCTSCDRSSPHCNECYFEELWRFLEMISPYKINNWPYTRKENQPCQMKKQKKKS